MSSLKTYYCNLLAQIKKCLQSTNETGVWVVVISTLFCSRHQNHKLRHFTEEMKWSYILSGITIPSFVSIASNYIGNIYC